MTSRTEPLRELEMQMSVIARRLRRAITERAAALDPSLGALGYVVLEYLQRNGAHRQTDLVCVLESEKGAVSRAVQQLVGLGFVERVPDPADGRVHRVAISADGAARFSEVAAARRASYFAKLADWTPDEIQRLVADLTRYNEALESPQQTV